MFRRASMMCAALVLVLTGTAWAGSGQTLSLRLVDQSLNTLPFGEDAKALQAWLEKRQQTLYAPKFNKAFDSHEKRMLRAELSKQIKDFTSSEIKFEGQRTGFETSVISGEFAVGSGESLLVYRDNAGTHFFFFSEGKLFKYARPLGKEVSFKERTATFARDLGVGPTKQTQALADVEARWDGMNVNVRIVDRRAVYHTDLLIVEHPTMASKVAALRQNQGNKFADVDPDLADILGTDDDVEEADKKDLE